MVYSCDVSSAGSASVAAWLIPRVLVSSCIALKGVWAETGRDAMVQCGIGRLMIASAAVYVIGRAVSRWWRQVTGEDELEKLRAQLVVLKLNGGIDAGSEHCGDAAVPLPPMPPPTDPPVGPAGTAAALPAAPADPGVVGPSMSAFHAFATGVDSSAPFSMTGAGGAPPAGSGAGQPPPLAPQLASGSGAAASAGVETRSAAALCAVAVREILAKLHSRASSNPWWANCFGKEGHQLVRARGPRLRRRGHGAASKREGLGDRPDRLRAPARPGRLRGHLRWSGGHWRPGGGRAGHALPPDFKRAGIVDMCRNICAAGSTRGHALASTAVRRFSRR